MLTTPGGGHSRGGFLWLGMVVVDAFQVTPGSGQGRLGVDFLLRALADASNTRLGTPGWQQGWGQGVGPEPLKTPRAGDEAHSAVASGVCQQCFKDPQQLPIWLPSEKPEAQLTL